MQQTEREMPATDEIAAGSPPPSGPCAMVIFGGTGDLTGRKLFPAPYNLAKSKMLSQDFAIVGVGRNDYTHEQYRQVMGEKLQSFATSEVDAELRDWLIPSGDCLSGAFREPTSH